MARSRILQGCAVVALTASLTVATVQARCAVDVSKGDLLAGNPAGVALIEHVVKRYLTVPGVKATFAIPGLRGMSLVSLRSGVIVAEELRFMGGPGAYVYVARRGAPTYKRTPSKPCWQPLERIDRQTFEFEIGSRFAIRGLASVQAPKRVRGGWTLAVTSSDNPTQEETLMIDTSYLLRSIVDQFPNGKRIVYRIRALTSPPHIAAPRPLC